MTPDLFASEDAAPGEGIDIGLPDARVVLYADFLARLEADQLLQTLRDHIAWRQEFIRLYRREYPVPRLTAWYGDPGKGYTYSGIRHEPSAWTVALAQLKGSVEARTGVAFNSVLLNRYRDQRDGVAWHSDDEPELGPRPVIASVSLGEEREMQFRHRARPALRHQLVLPHGSLLLMGGDTQRHWQHQIPKRQRALGERINLTFRFVQA